MRQEDRRKHQKSIAGNKIDTPHQYKKGTFRVIYSISPFYSPRQRPPEYKIYRAVIVPSVDYHLSP